MKPRQLGVTRIFLYNWPIYLATWSGAILAIAFASHLPSPLLAWAARLGALVAIAWSAFSLWVSFHVYDRSPLVDGAWLAPFLPVSASPLRWATIHAGLDAEIDLDQALGPRGPCLARLDIFDPAVMTAPSIRRARLRTAQMYTSVPSSPTKLDLTDAGCDLVVVAFTAHELRDASVRERFFVDVARALRFGGRMVLVEHLRDLANFAAFGPGFLHFVARAEWQRLAAHARLRTVHETRVTPFVMAVAYEKVAHE